MSDRLSLAADCNNLLGEGPVWVTREQALWWTDIKGLRLYRIAADGALSSWETPFRIGSLAPRREGGFIAGTDQGIAFVDPEAGRYEPLFDPEEDRPGNRFNDGKLDRQGRFWAGTMDDREEEASGALYRIAHDLSCARTDDGYKVTNGPAFSPDGRTLYHNDSARQLTYAFDLTAEGDAVNRRVFAAFEEADGYPDGMTVDAEGCLWVAFWDGWCLRRFSPSGECLAKVELPVQRPTSCAFGGPGLDRLYVTSARIDLDEAALLMQPSAGGLFVLETGTVGVAETPFAG